MLKINVNIIGLYSQNIQVESNLSFVLNKKFPTYPIYEELNACGWFYETEFGGYSPKRMFLDEVDQEESRNMYLNFSAPEGISLEDEESEFALLLDTIRLDFINRLNNGWNWDINEGWFKPEAKELPQEVKEVFVGENMNGVWVHVLNNISSYNTYEEVLEYAENEFMEISGQVCFSCPDSEEDLFGEHFNWCVVVEGIADVVWDGDVWSEIQWDGSRVATQLGYGNRTEAWIRPYKTKLVKVCRVKDVSGKEDFV